MLGRVHYHRENFKECGPVLPAARRGLRPQPAPRRGAEAGDHRQEQQHRRPAVRRQGHDRGNAPDQRREGDQPDPGPRAVGKLLDEQALMVRYQQAEKDFETAEFYRRTGHPGSAWFYYELVIRRYPGIQPWADQAAARQTRIEGRIGRDEKPDDDGDDAAVLEAVCPRPRVAGLKGRARFAGHQGPARAATRSPARGDRDAGRRCIASRAHVATVNEGCTVL